MKTDSELESLLRTTLDDRAATVDRAPAWVAPPTRRRAAPRWLPASAAAAAVVLIAAGVLIGLRLSHGTRPAHHPPAPGPTLHPMQCVVALPDSWRSAVTAGTVTVPGHTLTAKAVDEAGDVIADEAPDVAVPFTHTLVAITPTGDVRTVYDRKPPSSWHGMRIGTVSAEGHWVAFAVLVQASSGGQGPVQIELVNTSTGATRTLRPTTPNAATIVLGPAISHGSVYWTELDAPHGRMVGPVYRYDIATGARTVASRGVSSGPMRSGGGVYWETVRGVVGHRAGRTPPDFDLAGAVMKDRPVLTSGATSVWQDVSTMSAIKVWRSGMPHALVAVPARRGGLLTGISGNFVWWAGPRGAWVLDTRTGAAAEVSGFDTLHTGYPVLAATHGAAVQLSAARIAVLDTASLPGLHC